MERTADVKMGKTVKAEKDIFPKMWKEAKIKNSYKRFLEKKGIRLYTSDVTRWKEKKSSGGKAYRLAKAKIGLSYDGYLFPLLRKASSWMTALPRRTLSLLGIRNRGAILRLALKKRRGG